jgi:hypothetical protein
LGYGFFLFACTYFWRDYIESHPNRSRHSYSQEGKEDRKRPATSQDQEKEEEMKYTAIVVNIEGEFDHSFSFVGSHDKRLAFEDAQDLFFQSDLLVIAIVPGHHPVYAPSLDE